MATISAARTALRSAATSCRSAATSSRSAASAAKPKMPSTSPFRTPSQSARIFRSPVEMCAVQSMLPFHTATASALLNSMLSVAPSCWTIEDCNDDE